MLLVVISKVMLCCQQCVQHLEHLPGLKHFDCLVSSQLKEICFYYLADAQSCIIASLISGSSADCIYLRVYTHSRVARLM